MELRVATEGDERILRRLLYLALHVEPEEDPFPASIVDEPGWAKWYRNWGRPGDFGLLIEGLGGVAGGAWMRYFDFANKGFGFVAENIPELTIAIMPGYRGQGFGTRLLQGLLAKAKEDVAPGLSLSIDPRNKGAVRLYERVGFRHYSAQLAVMYYQFQSTCK